MCDTPATCFGRYLPSSGRWLTDERKVANYVTGVQLIIVHLYVLHVHNLFQSECFTECDLVLPLLIFSILSFS